MWLGLVYLNTRLLKGNACICLKMMNTAKVYLYQNCFIFQTFQKTESKVVQCIPTRVVQIAQGRSNVPRYVVTQMSYYN